MVPSVIHISSSESGKCSPGDDLKETNTCSSPRYLSKLDTESLTSGMSSEFSADCSVCSQNDLDRTHHELQFRESAKRTMRTRWNRSNDCGEGLPPVRPRRSHSPTHRHNWTRNSRNSVDLRRCRRVSNGEAGKISQKHLLRTISNETSTVSRHPLVANT